MADPLGALLIENPASGGPHEVLSPQQEPLGSAAAAATAAVDNRPTWLPSALQDVQQQQQQRQHQEGPASPLAALAATAATLFAPKLQSASPAAPPSPRPPAEAAQPLPPPPTRAQQFRRVLDSEPAIDMRQLRALAFDGVPDVPGARGLRAAVWRLLLGLLPPERAQWERALRRKRAEYEQFCEELILDPKNLSTPAGMEAAPGSHPNPLLSQNSGASSGSSGSNGDWRPSDGGGGGLEGSSGSKGDWRPTDGGGGGLEGSSGSGSGAAAAAGGARAGLAARSAAAAAAAAAEEVQRLALSPDDHPLSNSSSSKWKAYFQDVEVQEQIERDVARTHPDMHFFSGEGGAAALHRAQMRRALFVFAKLNPGLRYVQGMNELYAPLYYIFRTDPDAEAAQHAEADAFFCFVDLMGEFRDQFCQQLDNSTVGIRATLGRLSQLVRQQDEELWEHLEKGVKINPQFYAFRWITLALTQEFAFPDALRLWDSLLSDPAGRTDCLLRLCAGMLLHVRAELMRGDFATCMKMLQRFPPVDVQVILERAEAIKRTKSVIVLPD